jgi:selenocysteine-specific elongation factor
MPKEELRSTFGKNVDPRAFAALLAWMQSSGKATADATTVRSAEFTVRLNPRQQALLDRIAELYGQAGYNTPSVEEASQAVGAPPDAVTAMLRVGQDQGLLEKLADGLYYHRDTWEAAKQIVREEVRAHGSITVSQFRDITGSSRKYALPVMEHMDAVRFTRRVGDARTLVEE